MSDLKVPYRINGPIGGNTIGGSVTIPKLPKKATKNAANVSSTTSIPPNPNSGTPQTPSLYSYSRSPLGLVISSGEADRNSVGRYISATGSSTGLKSLFSRGENRDSFTFGPISSYDSDITTTSIINYTQKISSMSLKYSDFAYLKNLGVYPNNRLIIARRFNSAVDDDLTSTHLKDGISPVATLISWVPDNQEFISTEFGEEWVDAEASFKGILNDLGKDVMMGDNRGKSLGDAMAGGMGAIPLPGFTEGLQYEVFKQLGMTDLNASQLPLGNPNLIREAKRRKTLDKEASGSGLKCKFKVEMTVEYEQKFINGVDPTVVYYDIIANALTFGTSEAQFQFKGGKNVDDFSKFINKLGSGDAKQLKEALTMFITAISNAISKVADTLISLISKGSSSTSNGDEKNSQSEFKKNAEDLKVKNNKDQATAINALKQGVLKTVQGLVSKYKLRIMGVVNSLTGTPSAPWHVTIGNPKRPIFSSGDMIVEEVQLTMGKLLAFNDLPSSIKLKFTLTSARNLGSQEIFKKFNCGKERTYYKIQQSFVETDITIDKKDLDQAKASIENTNRVANGTINSTTPTKTQADNAGKETFPDPIKTIPNVQYLVSNPDKDGNSLVVANGKLKNYVKNTKTNKFELQTTDVAFWPGGRAFITTSDGSVLSASWKSNVDGSVEIFPDDNTKLHYASFK